LSRCLGNTNGVGPYLGALRCVPTLDYANPRVLVDGSGYQLATALGGIEKRYRVTVYGNGIEYRYSARVWSNGME
jgi:hypothetical protein